MGVKNVDYLVKHAQCRVCIWEDEWKTWFFIAHIHVCVIFLCVGSWFTEWKASEWWRNINAGRYRWAKQPPASSVTCGVCFHCQEEAVPNSYQPAEHLKVIQEKKVRNPHCTPPMQRRVRLRKHAVFGHYLPHCRVRLFVLLHHC